MIDVNAFFINRKTDEKTLLAFGFHKRAEDYVYTAPVCDGLFEMTVTVTNAGMVSAEIIDPATNDEYVLHLVDEASGEFVGNVRKEYDRILSAIAESCFGRAAFSCNEAGAAIDYVKEKYGDDLEFLWERNPENAICRRKDNKKWYAVFMTIPEKRLGTGGDEKITVLDLRMNPAEANALIDNERFFPGYHMNKTHWLTIRLDGSVPVRDVFNRIDISYKLAKK